MQRRRLGSQGLEVAAIGLGTMGMTMAYGKADESGGIATIRRAHELGVTMFDTAELYGLGTGASERLLGQAVASFRDEVVLATKFGFDMSAEPLGSELDSRPEHILEVVDNSLGYLGTDHIDLLYQHRVDPDVPIEDVAGTVGELVAAGKVRYFGLSEAGADTIRRAHAAHPVSVLQTEYSIFEREVEDEILAVVRELGIGFVAYSPLGRGFLTADVKPASAYPPDDMRTYDPRWQPGNYERNASAIAELSQLAADVGVEVTQLALAWLLAQGQDIVPIPGTRDPDRLERNVASADVVLNSVDLDRVRSILPQGAYGSRYVPEFMPKW